MAKTNPAPKPAAPGMLPLTEAPADIQRKVMNTAAVRGQFGAVSMALSLGYVYQPNTRHLDETKRLGRGAGASYAMEHAAVIRDEERALQLLEANRDRIASYDPALQAARREADAEAARAAEADREAAIARRAQELMAAQAEANRKAALEAARRELAREPANG